MFNSILVPTDGSKLSQKAIEKAILLASTTGASLVALHVYPKFGGGPYGTVGHAKDAMADVHMRHHEAQAAKMFDGVARLASAADVKLDCVLAEGDDVHQQILAVARKRRCDLICMASHGRRGLAGVVLGSETQKVLTHSALPVLVVR